MTIHVLKASPTGGSVSIGDGEIWFSEVGNHNAIEITAIID